MTLTVYRNAVIDSPAHPAANALVVRDEQIAWIGDVQQLPPLPPDARLLDVGGGILLPAFVDAHVHTTATGMALTGVDCGGVHDASGLLAAVDAAADADPASDWIVGYGWDEIHWSDPTLPTPAQLATAARGKHVYLARVDVHSALVSTTVRTAVPGLEQLAGFDPMIALRCDAHHAVRRLMLESLSAAQRGAAQRAALEHAVEHGLAAIHECGGPNVAGEADFRQLLAAVEADPVVEVYGWWGEADVTKARQLGAVGAGGDLFVDGSLGSHTAWLRENYADHHTAGASYLDSDAIADHVVACVAAGMPAGFHAIGDAAIAAVLAGYAKAATSISINAIRAGRHRVEHAEMLDATAIRGLVEFGLVVSAQPAFDAQWGGSTGMYARRLGGARAAALNPLAPLHNVGVCVAFGSDAPATPIGPWGAIRAAVHPSNPQHALTPRAAFAAHTRGGWRAIGDDVTGVLLPGAPATFALWQADGVASGAELLAVTARGTEDPVCLATIVRGAQRYVAPRSSYFARAWAD